MAKGPDWERTKKFIRPRLQPGEPAELFVAWVPRKGDYRGLTFVAYLPLILALDYVTNLIVIRKASRAAGVPLAARMIMAFSARRLIICRATRRWEFSEVMGDLPLDRIGSVDVSRSGSRSRAVTLGLKTGGTVTLKMPADRAVRFGERVTEVLTEAR